MPRLAGISAASLSRLKGAKVLLPGKLPHAQLLGYLMVEGKGLRRRKSSIYAEIEVINCLEHERWRVMSLEQIAAFGGQFWCNGVSPRVLEGDKRIQLVMIIELPKKGDGVVRSDETAEGNKFAPRASMRCC